MTILDRLIEQFRDGKEFDGKIDPYLTDGTLDEKSLERLARALRREEDGVRMQVARLLKEAGRQTDPLYAEGGNLIRNAGIVNVLVSYGLAKPGSVRSYVLEVLQQLVPAEMLGQFGTGLVENAREHPDPVALLIIAKAKIALAGGLVDSLMAQPQWSRQVETAIAKAALGDEKLEQEFIDQFLAAEDAEEKADLARRMALVGTKGTLRALAGEMRSDLEIEDPGHSVRSIRVDFVAALSYAYPDKAFLWDNAVVDDTGYERIEKFCEEEFGVEWKKPRPAFLWIEGLSLD